MLLPNSYSLYFFAPESILGAGTLVILAWDLLFPKLMNRRVAGLMTLATLVASGIALWVTSGETHGLFHGLVARDPYSDFWKYLFLAVTGIVGIIATRSKETIDYTDRDRDAAEFYGLNLSVCLGMFLMASATDMLTGYLSLEFVSILSFVLAGYKRRNRKSSEAALKYAIYGGVASGVMLYGLSLLYGMAGSTSIAAIRDAAVVTSSPTTLIIAVTCTMAGFGYKIASVPFHMWCPDVYEGAPTPITAFLSVGPKAAGFALLMRFLTGVPHLGVGDVELPWPTLLGAIAVATMTLGNVVAIVQSNVKRMLAYSSIAHAGYVLLGVVVATDAGRQAVMVYLVTYLFMNIGAFAVVIALAEKGIGETIDDFKGLGYRAPYVGAAMAVFLVSLTGLPPTAGFIGKFLLFAALLEKPGTLPATLAVIGVLNSAVSLYYYARILKAMYFDKAPEGAPLSIDRQHSVMLGAMAVPIVLLGLFWAPLQRWAESSLGMWGQ